MDTILQYLSSSHCITILLLGIYIIIGLIFGGIKKSLLYIHTRMMRKRNILLLKESVSDIIVKNVEGKDFSFVTDNLEKTSIEERDTFNLIGSEEFNQRLQKLRRHYESIKKEIKEKQIPEKVLSIKDIDYVLKYVITEQNIEAAIEKLNKKRENNDAELAFIGNKVGLYEYEYEKDKMIWHCYRSDHFTWKIFKELYLLQKVPVQGTKSPHQFFNDLCFRLAKYQKTQSYREVLMHTLCYLFSSLGIDLLITGKDCKNHKVCLASVRSARIERNHLSRIHVSVDESFSDTDQANSGVYSVNKWALRGIEEEIGVFEETQKKETDKERRIEISYTDFAIILGYGEIGLSGIAKDKEIDTILAYPGMDKALESEGMFLVPMPGFWKFIKIACSDYKNNIQRYVEKYSDQPQAKLPWVEFAPPIYFRTMLRELTYPSIKNALVFISFLSLVNNSDCLLDFFNLDQMADLGNHTGHIRIHFDFSRFSNTPQLQ